MHEQIQRAVEFWGIAGGTGGIFVLTWGFVLGMTKVFGTTPAPNPIRSVVNKLRGIRPGIIAVDPAED